MKDLLNTNIEADEEKRREEARAAREKELDDIREVLKTATGRRVIYRIIEHCRPFTESYVVGSFDATSNNEGRRMVGNWLWSEVLDADQERYHQMLRERKSALVVKEMERKNLEENNG